LVTEFTRFCQLSEVPAESKKAARINDTWVMVCHSNGRLFAVSAICSHQFKPLVNGRMRNCAISCPVHGARFSLETGAALDLPATKPIATYELRVVDDWIEVRI
jgi:3-phenylpropionate/trans-cinnamate dioxygenase ferredoxin component